MSKTCDLCHSEIMRWQSYQLTGSTVSHLACILGHAPAPHPTAHFSHTNTQFNKGDLRRERHTVTSDEGVVFDAEGDVLP